LEMILSLAVSLHLGMEKNYNFLHPHLRLVDYNDFIYGIYYNSEYDISVYAGKMLEYNDIQYEFGIVNGYTDFKISPYFRIKKDSLFVAPATEDGKLKGIVIGLEQSF